MPPAEFAVVIAYQVDARGNAARIDRLIETKRVIRVRRLG
jgi:hypothetical protein